MAQLPEIPWLARRHRCGPPGIDGISGIGWVILKVRGQLIDLDRGKAGDRDVEILHHQQLGQLRQLRGQQLAVPAGILGNLVVGKGKRAALGLRQTLHFDRRHLLVAQQFCRGVAPMAGDHDPAFVHQDRNQKAECRDAVGNLADLLLGVGPRIARIRLDRLDGDPFNYRHDFLL